ncbi:unnamed protein product [Tuber aestivum]|uniref:Uncharacterized protein n=1 Tax=Tuber aestivum TaxID=59557 RepID=A0A292Q3C4_9PEZI|nr:unnamed protein product [Tuber aestivum]
MVPPSPISSQEANHYYHGLYSRPVLVARTGTNLWKPPVSPPGYFLRKVLLSVGNHPLTELWEANLALQIHKILDSKEIKWTSTDVVRIGVVGESITPVIIWIGVQPDTLSWEAGYSVAIECKELLVANRILDVEVEIRESVVTRYSDPTLAKPAALGDPTAELLEPLTSTLGLSICNMRSEWAEGTGGFYVLDKTKDSKLYLVKARHVVYERKRSSQPYDKIALFSSTAFINYLEQITTAIEDKIMVQTFQTRVVESLRGSEGIDSGPATRNLASQEALLQEATEAIVAMKILYKNVVKSWDTIENRIIGHLWFSPPLRYGAGSAGYTQDYAVIELDKSKINNATFTGNAIDLGTQMTSVEFTRLMFPNPTGRHNFKYPLNRLFPVRGMVPDDEMRRPPMVDHEGNPCLIVMKRGISTGLTIGRATNLVSYTRHYGADGNTKAEDKKQVAKLLGKLEGLGVTGMGLIVRTRE